MASGNQFDLDNFRGVLDTPYGSGGKNADCRPKREKNIRWIHKLDRDDLTHGETERQIQFTETDSGEKLLIQYPGKESLRDGSNRRPWDFRPKVLFPDGTYGPDHTFADSWKPLFDEFGVDNPDADIARALGVLFYRMAFMMDHEPEWGDVSLPTRLTDGDGSGKGPFKKKTHPALFRYSPPEGVIDAIASEVPELGGMSIRGYLHYINLLAFNEDCKYYYLDTDGGEKAWNWPRKGRINTLLTYVSIIGLVTGDRELHEVLNRMTNGVCTVTEEQAHSITDGIIGEP